ncbi:hypothetical protein [Chitinasiproducens palmae]|uniref:hypothetical protein n=1 Tax=Chitinasiproducens palmae TaxID=1770053 RepID=UPI0011137307|nr:hypothetical protein [Chitinasiproducens palmae]
MAHRQGTDVSPAVSGPDRLAPIDPGCPVLDSTRAESRVCVASRNEQTLPCAEYNVRFMPLIASIASYAKEKNTSSLAEQSDV